MSSASGLPLRVLPGRGPLRRAWGSVGGRSSVFLVERHALVYRHTWLVFVSGVVEPLFYLLSIGVGLGHLVGSVRGVSYAAFVAPALLASASMNGALFDSTFNVFFRLKYEKLYDAALATPMRAGDVALGEISWALLRGALYAVAFLAVMAAMGLVHSWWALAALPAAMLTGFAFAAAWHGLHHVHADLAGLRVRHAGDPAHVPVLDHVLPAERVPAGAAVRGGMHTAVPERGHAA